MSMMWMGRPRDPAAEAARLIGTAVTVAVPVQRRRPEFILALSIAELAALASVIATTNAGAFVALIAIAAALAIAGATNRHQVLAVTPTGVVRLAASARGRPRAVVGAADVTWPQPHGLSAAVRVSGETWWADRAAFGRIATAGGWPGSSS